MQLLAPLPFYGEIVKTFLVYGLPGSGKTTFATKLKKLFRDRAVHFNSDMFRKLYNDWDFSDEGQLRQVERMRNAALNAFNENKFAIIDFVCPKREYRKIIDADYNIYMNLPSAHNSEDKTAIFEYPDLETEKDIWVVDTINKADSYPKMIVLGESFGCEEYDAIINNKI